MFSASPIALPNNLSAKNQALRLLSFSSPAIRTRGRNGTNTLSYSTVTTYPARRVTSASRCNHSPDGSSLNARYSPDFRTYFSFELLPLGRIATVPCASAGGVVVISTACPHCNQKMQAPENLVNRQVKCPVCKKPFAVRRPVASIATARVCQCGHVFKQEETSDPTQDTSLSDQ
jgi:hypothetical protein